ncbi:transcriptional regulator with XRE-family HTH domain [Sporosarcina luteola]|nr:transcriptional regulator with XRE-family HTH domain [Sporosarcina luteola]
MLSSKGYLSAKGTVNQIELGKDLLEYYSEELLVYLNCELKIGDNNCWLRLITSKHRSIFHPLKHILLLLFLNKSIDDIDEIKGEKYLPFGNGKYPCLNPAAEHYKQLCIDDVTLGRERNRGGKPRGLFECLLCGFSYSRIGPDNSEEDKYRYNKVINFGSVWFDKLKKLNEDGFTNKEIAKKLNVGVHTVWRYLNGFERKEIPKVSNKKVQNLKQRWLQLIEQNPTYSQNQIRNLDKGLYSSLYAIDSEWLKNNSPKSTVYSKGNKRVDWSKRDKDYLVQIKYAIEKIENLSPPQRVTLNRIENIANLSRLNKNLDKLPETNDYLSDKLESIEAFQLRRIKWAMDEIERSGEEITYSKVVMKANVYKASSNILDEIKKALGLDS